jgi:hypothetical protein
MLPSLGGLAESLEDLAGEVGDFGVLLAPIVSGNDPIGYELLQREYIRRTVPLLAQPLPPQPKPQPNPIIKPSGLPINAHQLLNNPHIIRQYLNRQSLYNKFIRQFDE